MGGQWGEVGKRTRRYPFFKKWTSKHACYEHEFKLRIVLTNLAQHLTRCNEMNAKSAYVRNISELIYWGLT